MPNDRASTNHDALFPDHVVAATDLTVLRNRIADFETQTDLAASADCPTEN